MNVFANVKYEVNGATVIVNMVTGVYAEVTLSSEDLETYEVTVEKKTDRRSSNLDMRIKSYRTGILNFARLHPGTACEGLVGMYVRGAVKGRNREQYETRGLKATKDQPKRKKK